MKMLEIRRMNRFRNRVARNIKTAASKYEDPNANLSANIVSQAVLDLVSTQEMEMQKERVDKALADYVESVEKEDGKHVKLHKKYRSEKRRLIALSIYDSERDFRYGSIEQWCEHGWLDYRRLCVTLRNAGFLTTDWGIDGAQIS